MLDISYLCRLGTLTEMAEGSIEGIEMLYYDDLIPQI
jgi:hypothetical protein